MTFGESKEICNLRVKLRSGASIVRVKPLFTHDSKSIVIASGSDVKIYAIQSGECTHTLKYHETQVVGLQENKKNHLQVFSCSDDGVIVRWDLTEGRALQVHRVQMNVSSFFVPTSENVWFVTKKIKDPVHYRLYSVIPKPTKCVGYQMVISSVLPGEDAVAFAFDGTFVAAVFGNALNIYTFETKTIRKHLLGQRKFECVASHPSDYILATGDDQGRVIVWSNIFDVRCPIKSIYHWHSLPIGAVAFSTEGSYLYSGGGEAVLVKWNLFSDERSILPRLGAPISHLNVAQDNSCVLTAHSDNTLQIISSQKNVIQVIQGLSRGHFQGAKGKDILPTGLLYDSLRNALVMNGKPGHLQFYNVLEDKQLFNLDIAGRNVISQERDSTVLNTDVQKAAIDDKGCWLATAEFWNDEETSPQIWLKFWEYNIAKQTYVLNTNVILPHNKEVNCIIFRPRASVEDSPLVVSTSNDGRFKVWILKDDVCFNERQSWTCESMGCYRDLPAGSACFSEEGSLLAVAFGDVATLWTVDGTTLEAVLHHETKSSNIQQLVFGKQSSSHLLVCHDETSIIVWNVLSLSISWIVSTEVEKLAADGMSDVMAAFCKDHSLTFFRPDNPEPVCYVEGISSEAVMAAAFVPLNKGGKHFYEKSQLFFFDADQNLYTLTDDCEEEADHNFSQKVTIQQSLPLTPFGMLQAESKVSGVKAAEAEALVENFLGGKDVLEISCPTLTDPLALCAKVLKSMLIPSTK